MGNDSFAERTLELGRPGRRHPLRGTQPASEEEKGKGRALSSQGNKRAPKSSVLKPLQNAVRKKKKGNGKKCLPVVQRSRRRKIKSKRSCTETTSA